MLYQVICLLCTHVANCNRNRFEVGYASSVKDKIDVELRRESLERVMREAQTTSADNILASLNTLYKESVVNIGIDPIAEGEEGEMDPSDVEDVERDTSGKKDNQSSLFHTKTKVSMKTMHVNISDDIFALGRAKLAGKDVITIRGDADRVRNRKADVRKAIMNTMALSESNCAPISVGVELDVIPRWQLFSRRMRSRLNL